MSYHAYDVYLNGREIDTVFQSPNNDGSPVPASEVRHSLINHDGYDPGIRVELRAKPKRKTRWFTFGQSHAHSVDGFTYDKDVVVQITAEDPRSEMVKAFGMKWGMEYRERPKMDYFPRGIKVLQ